MSYREDKEENLMMNFWLIKCRRKSSCRSVNQNKEIVTTVHMVICLKITSFNDK